MKKSIGILGGMGPLATADLFRKIVLLTDAARDNDHIRVYIDDNASIPDRTAAILSGGADPLPAMTDSLRKLEACGADCIIMPCNTAHYFLPRLQAPVPRRDGRSAGHQWDSGCRTVSGGAGKGRRALPSSPRDRTGRPDAGHL